MIDQVRARRIEDTRESDDRGAAPVSTAIEAAGLSKSYGRRDALTGVTFAVDEGEVIGLLGPNGAGKTTLIKLLCGAIPASSGSLVVLGFDPSREGVRSKQMVGVVHQQSTFDMFLSADDNLQISAAFNALRWADVRSHVDSLLDVFELTEKRSMPVLTLSGGERRRLQVVRALLKRPRLLLLDEPSAGLDVASRRKVWSLLRSLRSGSGTTIIWTSHYVEELERNCDRVMVLNKGAVVRFDTPAALTRGSACPRLVMEFSRPIDLSQCELVLRRDHCDFALTSDRIEVTARNVRDKIPALLSALGPDSVFLSEMRITSETLEDAYLALLEDGSRAQG